MEKEIINLLISIREAIFLNIFVDIFMLGVIGFTFGFTFRK